MAVDREGPPRGRPGRPGTGGHLLGHLAEPPVLGVARGGRVDQQRLAVVRLLAAESIQQGKGYDEAETAWLTSGFFLAADLGSLGVGAAVLALARRGLRLSRARLVCYAGCTAMTAASVLAAVLPRGPALVAALFVVGFGRWACSRSTMRSSQEISARHQGKVTGTLSCLNAAYLALWFPLQGRLIDWLGSFSVASAWPGCSRSSGSSPWRPAGGTRTMNPRRPGVRPG